MLHAVTTVAIVTTAEMPFAVQVKTVRLVLKIACVSLAVHLTL
jgi:hypothetical protein